jgi:hypothetical protein
MFGSLGVPELIVILILGTFYVVPIAAAVWAIFTLHRIRTDQEAMGVRLETIERLLQGRG